MSDINLVVLTGRVGADPEIKDAGGTELAHFNLAVSEWAGQDKGERTTWVRINLWGNRTKVAEYIHKGMKLTIRGRLSIREAENKEGQKVWYTSVNVDDLILPDKQDSGPTKAKKRRQSGSSGSPF